MGVEGFEMLDDGVYFLFYFILFYLFPQMNGPYTDVVDWCTGL